MERPAKKIIKRSLKIVNLILCIAGIAILTYSLSIILVASRKHTQYFFLSWFLWATIIAGLIFCFTSCIGYGGAATRGKFVLSSYILCIVLVLLMEILVVGDICLNDDWEKDFPMDRAQRFGYFMDLVHSHETTFTILAFIIFLLQVSAFGLAMALRVTNTKQGSESLPLLAHQVVPTGPYVVGQPFHAAQSYVEESKKVVKNLMSAGEKEAWLMCTSGCPPPCYIV